MNCWQWPMIDDHAKKVVVFNGYRTRWSEFYLYKDRPLAHASSRLGILEINREEMKFEHGITYQLIYLS